MPLEFIGDDCSHHSYPLAFNLFIDIITLYDTCILSFNLLLDHLLCLQDSGLLSVLLHYKYAATVSVSFIICGNWER